MFLPSVRLAAWIPRQQQIRMNGSGDEAGDLAEVGCCRLQRGWEVAAGASGDAGVSGKHSLAQLPSPFVESETRLGWAGSDVVHGVLWLVLWRWDAQPPHPSLPQPESRPLS